MAVSWYVFRTVRRWGDTNSVILRRFYYYSCWWWWWWWVAAGRTAELTRLFRGGTHAILFFSHFFYFTHTIYDLHKLGALSSRFTCYNLHALLPGTLFGGSHYLSTAPLHAAGHFFAQFCGETFLTTRTVFHILHGFLRGIFTPTLHWALHRTLISRSRHADFQLFVYIIWQR